MSFCAHALGFSFLLPESTDDFHTPLGFASSRRSMGWSSGVVSNDHADALGMDEDEFI